MENVRVTAPDLERRVALEKTRSRLVIAAGGFTALFAAVLAKLALATIVMPMAPHRPERLVADIVRAAPRQPVEATMPGQRAMITDRNGQPMAISLSTVSLFADPRQIGDADDAARKLKQVLPQLDLAETTDRLKRDKKFIYLAREITPRQELAINDLGIPGIDFRPTQHREYPLGRTAAQVLGGVDVDQSGFAGVEQFFDERLRTNTDPLRLSIDLQVQAAVREELVKAMDTFTAIGGCGIVMDVHTGEVLAMVSLPDYDANLVRTAPPDDRFNRAVEGTYEPGSTFKLQTASMALDSGLVHIWDQFDASHNISIGRFTISDFEGKHRWLYLPEVLAYSSNLGAAHIAVTIGGERQRAWLKSMGMFGRTGIELPESARPIVQPAANWKEIATMTVGFGHGISVTPLHVVRGTAAVANGGILVKPTILAKDRMPPRWRAGDAAGDLRHHAQADAAGGDRRVRQVGRGARLLPRRQDRHGGEGRGAWRLQEARQRRGLHERVPDERAALRRLHDAGRAARDQGHLWLRDGRLGGGARGRQGDRPDRPDAWDAAGHRRHAADQPGAGDPAASPAARRARSRVAPGVGVGGGQQPEPAGGTNRPNLTIPATILPPAISRPAPDIRRQTEAAPAQAPLTVAVSAAASVADR